MFRPRLKSSAGCTTCKIRAKKCDEARPKCRECLRLSLSCVWVPKRKEDPQHQQSWKRYKTSEYRFSVHPAISPGYYQLRSQLEVRLFLIGGEALRALQSPLVEKDDRNVNQIMSILVHESWVREQLTSNDQNSSAFFAYIMILISEHGKAHRFITGMYSLAVRELRAKISAVKFGDEKVKAVLLCMTFLGHVELMPFCNTDSAMTHFLGCVELLRSCRDAMRLTGGHFDELFARSIVEINLFLVACNSISCENISRLPRSVRCTEIESYFPNSITDQIDGSPYLSGRSAVEFLGTSKYQESVATVEARLCEIETRLDDIYAVASDNLHYSNYKGLARSPEVSALVRQGIQQMEAFTLSFRNDVTVSHALRWPIYIHLCAASDARDISWLELNLADAQKKMPSSSRVRADRVLEKIKSVRVSTVVSCNQDVGNACNARHDALHLLIDPTGLSDLKAAK